MVKNQNRIWGLLVIFVVAALILFRASFFEILPFLLALVMIGNNVYVSRIARPQADTGTYVLSLFAALPHSIVISAVALFLLQVALDTALDMPAASAEFKQLMRAGTGLLAIAQMFLVLFIFDLHAVQLLIRCADRIQKMKPIERMVLHRHLSILWVTLICFAIALCGLATELAPLYVTGPFAVGCLGLFVILMNMSVSQADLVLTKADERNGMIVLVIGSLFVGFVFSSPAEGIIGTVLHVISVVIGLVELVIGALALVVGIFSYAIYHQTAEYSTDDLSA